MLLREAAQVEGGGCALEDEAGQRGEHRQDDDEQSGPYPRQDNQRLKGERRAERVEDAGWPRFPEGPDPDADRLADLARGERQRREMNVPRTSSTATMLSSR